ncbi:MULTISPECIES: flagellar motor switch protein FliM [Methylomicrobium]|uniref:Flagellar motor switch protein FliM n=1 Tax=Methylomicrobium album BG8 TaxID=686340 RepID=H8GMV3_METAL|nr:MULTISPECIES: flagellar motor switch protein FliM [Methylomicrobium]EIC29505.1 flagellar motor switch protein FliM [Methylomicrobium album BG8]
MSTSDLLSQEEIEALLNSVEEGDFEPEAEVESIAEEVDAREVVKPYDFNTQERVVQRRHIRTLEMINDRFSNSLRTSLFKLLHRSPEIFVSGIQFQKFSDFMDRLRTPTNLNIVRISPLRGRALIVMDPYFVFTVVDNFFGGNGQYDHNSQGREFTRTEMRVIQKILDMIFKDLKDAWEPVLAINFEYLNSEINPNYAAIVGVDDYVMITTVNIALEGGGGDINILMPYAMIEPIKGLLESVGVDSTESDTQWRVALRNEVMEAKLKVNTQLVEKNLPISDILRLKKGDIIPIDMPKTLSLKAEGVSVFTCRPCTSEGHYAVQIIDKIVRTESV